MKVALVVCGKSPLTMPGGLAAYGFNVGRILHQLGYEVRLFGFSAEAGSTALDFGTLHHVRNPYSRLLGLGSLFAPSIFRKAMEEVFAQRGPSCEYLVFGVGMWGMAGVQFARKFRQNRIQTVTAYFMTLAHEYQGHIDGASARDYGRACHLFFVCLHRLVKCIYTPFERRILEGSEHVLIHYESTRRILRQQFPDIPDRRYTKIPYCVELYARQSSQSEPTATIRKSGDPSVVVACRQDPRKGIHVFLHAVKKLRDQGVRFDCCVAGEGIFLKRNRALAHRLGLGDDVRFLGFVDSVEELFARTDIFVLPSFEEGAGAISLLEAMKAGVAIVTTACDGIPEDFTSERNALIVPVGDVDRLAVAIRRLLLDSALRKRLAEQATRDYNSKFRFEQMAAGLETLLKPPVRETRS